MSIFEHHSVDLLGRQTRLIVASSGEHFLYDAATAIFTKLDPELGEALG